MNLEIKNFTEQMESIVYKCFDDEEVFKNMLRYKISHPNEKWYNIISIFHNRKKAQHVLSAKEWAKELNVKTVYFTRQSGIPYVDIYQEFDESNLELVDKQHIIKVFDYEQIDFNYEQFSSFRGKLYCINGPLVDFVKENEKDLFLWVSNVKNNFWKQFCQEECMKQKDYDTFSAEIQKEIVSSCLYASQKAFPTTDLLSVQHIQELNQEEKKRVFFLIDKVLENLADDLSMLHHSYMEKQQKIREKELLKKRGNRKLKQRITEAKERMLNQKDEKGNDDL